MIYVPLVLRYMCGGKQKVPRRIIVGAEECLSRQETRWVSIHASMQRQYHPLMRTFVGCLVVVLVILVGWRMWDAREVSTSAPAASPPTHVARSTSATSVPELASQEGSSSESADAERNIADDAIVQHVTERASEDSFAGPPLNAEPVITRQLPSYLDFYVSSADSTRLRNGCKDPLQLMAEMKVGTRDDEWAERIEEGLQSFLGPHPLGFLVTVTCRAAICQITALGPGKEILGNEEKYEAYWDEFMSKLRYSPIAAEFATRQYFGAPYPEDPSQEMRATC